MNGERGAAATGCTKDEVIGWANTFLGARLVQDNAKRLLEDAIALYGQDKHDSAIVLAVLASEESLKGIELSRYFRNRTPVTMDVWDKLKNHEYKLTNTYDWMMEQLQSEKSDEFYEKLTKERGKQHINGITVTPKMLLPITETNKKLHKRMRYVKEACMYQNWNRSGKKWGKILPYEEKSLAYYVIEHAHINFGMLLLSLDFALDTLMQDQPKLAKLKEPHPTITNIPKNANLWTDGEKALQKFPADDLATKPTAHSLLEGSNDNSSRELDLISPEQVRAGASMIQNRAKRLHEGAESLYSAGHFQNAIVLAILSIEESLKGEFVTAKAQKNQGITEKQWNHLQNHSYKLNSIDIVGEMLHHDDVKKFYRSQITRRAIPAFGRKNPTKDDIRSFRARMQSLRSGLNLVKKMCLYNGWITQYGIWDGFEYLAKDVRDDLAFCLVDMARWQLVELELVANCPALEDEAARNRDSGWLLSERDYDNSHKLLSGELVLGAILQEKLFAICPQVVTRNIAKKCMDIVSYTYYDSVNWHPVVKAFFMAYGKLLKSPDGEHEEEADNAKQTYEGKPTMHARVKIRKEGFRAECQKITVNGVEYGAHDSRIDALLEVEGVLKRWHGPEVSIERLGEALAAIGVGVYRLRDTEVADAIKRVNSSIALGTLQPPEKIAADVKAATMGSWDGLDPTARAYIASVYKKKTNALILSSAVDPIRKSKIRDMAWAALTEWDAQCKRLTEQIMRSRRDHGH